MAEFDIDTADQAMMLEALNEAIEKGKLPESTNETFDDGDDVMDMISDMINERLMEDNVNDIDEEEEAEEVVMPVMQYNVVNKNNRTYKEEAEMEELRNAPREIIIRRTDDEFRNLVISDMIRSITIDINTLDYDTTKMPNVDSFAVLSLNSVLTNFYPSAVIPINSSLEVFKKVTDYDNIKFYFFEYPEEEVDMIMGYYISEESLDVFGDLVEELDEKGQVLSFINALIEITDNQGFSFKNVTEAFRKQIVLLDAYKDSYDNFIQLFLEDEETEKDEDACNTIFDAVQVFPIVTDRSYIEQVLAMDDDNADMSDFIIPDEDDDMDEDELEEEIEEMKEELNEDIEEIEESEEELLEDEDAEEEEDLFDDLVEEEAPEIEFSSKKVVNDNEDDDFVIKRRN